MIVFFNFLALLIPMNHAIYISVIELTIINGEVDEMQVKIFADDLADAVRAERGLIIPIDTEYSEEHLKEIESYFEKHLFIKSRSSNKYFSIKGYSREDQASWFVLGLEQIIHRGDVLVADYLTELFSSQTNMLRLTVDRTQGFHQLKKGRAEYDIGNAID